MPSKSQKQHDTMVAACKDAAFAKKIGIPQNVACEFVAADKKDGLWQKPVEKKEKPIYHHWKDSK